MRDNTTGEIEPLNNAPPQGILHPFAPLALVTWQALANQQFTAQISDCRPLFPPLTDLRASDVSFDNEQLPAARRGNRPAGDRAALPAARGRLHLRGQSRSRPAGDVRSDPRHGDASICFQAGSFVLPGTVTLKNKGRLKLTGAGTGTRLIANKVEAALVFEGCESVLVRDLSAESRAQGAIEPHLNGVLTFLSCGEVHVEAVELRCSHATDTIAACLAVRPAAEPGVGARSARVLHSRFFVGNDQAGMLLINVERSQVEDNLLEVVEFPGAVKLADLVTGRRYRARLSRILFSNAKEAVAGAGAGTGANVIVKVGDFSISFLTSSALKKSWQPLVALFPPQRVVDAVGLQNHIDRLAEKVLVDDNVRAAVPAIRDFIAGLLKEAAAAAQQGIVIAGRSAAEVRVLNNTILGFRQGVHIGLSHRENAPGAPDEAVSVTVSGNRILCRLTFDALAEARHGIFCGNAASLLMENNRVSLERRKGAERYEVQGILLHGFFGPRLLVKENHLSAFRVGIQVEPLSRPVTPLPAARLWIVSENIAERAATVVQAPAMVTQINNVG